MSDEKAELKLGEKLIEGKTKIVSSLPDSPDGNHVFIQSKDRITAGDGARSNDMKGKAELSNATNRAIFELLNACGVKTHFIRGHDTTSFIAVKCEMIPLEVVTRRIATGSFLKRNPGVKEGYKFAPLKMETFFKDDANHDPQWSREQCVENALKIGGVTIGERELDIMGDTAIAVFEILEKAWATLDCTLVDMKVEFGVNAKSGEIILADVIDNDSWRLWPSGDRKLMKDKQVYRELKEITEEALQMVKRNFQWVVDHVQKLSTPPFGQAVIIMGSPSDTEHCKKIAKTLKQLGVNVDMRVSSAHKGTNETLAIVKRYESLNIPTVFIAVAGRSNGLGPVLSGNTALPVINCPPVTADWGSQDIWSSLRLPSGLGCTTVLGAEAAALAAAQILALGDHMVWCRLRARLLNTSVSLRVADNQLITQ